MTASNPGFDWLNLAALKSDSDLPPPPVSFGLTPTASSSTLNLTDQSQPSNSKGSDLSLNATIDNSDQAITPIDETAEDLSVPLKLDIEQLSPDEAKTYLRWYNDIVLTRGTRLIRLHDVFNFLSNFKLSKAVQLSIERIFRQCVFLDLGEFFALLRVISHTILGSVPRRKLIGLPAPLLRPKSILSAKKTIKHPREEEESSSSSEFSSKDNSKLDLDTFTQFILTGEKPSHKHHTNKKRNVKRVKFSDEVSIEPDHQAPVDLSLPMGELLARVPSIKRPSVVEQPSYQVNEEEELREMQEQVNHFQNVKNVDSASIHGVPSNIPSIFFDEARLNSPSPDYGALSPNSTGPIPGLLSPSHTGPVPFAKSLLASSYGLQPQNTQNDTQIDSNLLTPSMTGSLSTSMRVQGTSYGSPNYSIGELRSSSVSPFPAAESSNNNDSYFALAPPPMVPRLRSASSPAPANQEFPSIADQLQYQYDIQQQRATSPLPPPPPPTRRNRNGSAPPPPPSRIVSGPTGPAPPLPPKVALDGPQYPNNGFQSPIPQHNTGNNPYATTNPGSGSVYDRVLQDFTTNGTPVNGSSMPAPPSLAANGRTNSTADILGDLKALQSEVDRLQYFQR